MKLISLNLIILNQPKVLRVALVNPVYVLPYLHRGSFDITLTIPLKMKKENFLFFGVFFLYFTLFYFLF